MRFICFECTYNINFAYFTSATQKAQSNGDKQWLYPYTICGPSFTPVLIYL